MWPSRLSVERIHRALTLDGTPACGGAGFAEPRHSRWAGLNPPCRRWRQLRPRGDRHHRARGAGRQGRRHRCGRAVFRPIRSSFAPRGGALRCGAHDVSRPGAQIAMKLMGVRSRRDDPGAASRFRSARPAHGTAYGLSGPGHRLGRRQPRRPCCWRAGDGGVLPGFGRPRAA